MFGLTKQTSGGLRLEAYGFYNSAESNTYRPLKYSQASSLGRFHDLDFVSNKMGYFYMEQERPGPPTAWKLYDVSSEGLVFDKWQILSKMSKHRQSLSFLSGKYAWEPVSIKGGIKHLPDHAIPAIKTFDTTGIPDVSYEKALELATTIETDASAKTKHFNKLLPNFGLSYRMDERLSVYFSYGRNHAMSVALYPYFISQKSNFYAKGITLQDLWDKQELEIADNFDMGMRYITDRLYAVPTFYYAEHKNKLAVYYDNALDVSFPANNADANAYGFELEIGAMPVKNLSIYTSFSYNRFYFSQDMNTSSGSVISADGKQVPDAPRFLCKGILSYTLGGFTFSPIVKYTSSRYGDILHEEKIDQATIFDFDITYSDAFPKLKIRELELSFTINNVFDKEYIGIINTSDYKTLGSSYLAGAPRTIYAFSFISF